MSSIEVNHGTASVTLQGVDTYAAGGRLVPRYEPRDLLEATATALRGVGTQAADAWAAHLSNLVLVGPPRTPTTDSEGA